MKCELCSGLIEGVAARDRQVRRLRLELRIRNEATRCHLRNARHVSRNRHRIPSALAVRFRDRVRCYSVHDYPLQKP